MGKYYSANVWKIFHKEKFSVLFICILFISKLNTKGTNVKIWKFLKKEEYFSGYIYLRHVHRT